MICGTQKKYTSEVNAKWRQRKGCDDRTKLLGLRRPTATKDFKQSIPRPAYQPVKHHLPIWEHRELNEKIPMCGGPTGPIVLHRGQMGINPYVPKGESKMEFSLNDPYCHETSLKYNGLHDPNLKHWMKSAGKKEFLRKQRLITEENDVICNLKEYNEYRQFLWHHHNDMTMKKFRHNEKQNIERKQILKADLNDRRDIAEKLKRLNDIASKSKTKNVLFNKKTTKQKCKSPKESIKPLKIKKIETYTVFGYKNGLKDQNQYKGTFIKGTPENYHLLGFFNTFFKK